MKSIKINIANYKHRNILFIVSCVSLFFLLFSFSIFGLFVNPVICFILCKKLLNDNRDEITLCIRSIIFTIIVCTAVYVVFYNKWISSALLESICLSIGIPLKPLVIFGDLLLSAFSLISVYQGICIMFDLLKEKWQLTSPMDNNEKILAIAFCIISAFGIIGVCSKSSFLYPLNDWNDANCFFTVGKSMLNGIVPYRDLIEQKGPLLYFMHGLAWLVSHDSFLGVYFLESICAAFFLYYSYKTIRLYIDRKIVYLIPIVSSICYTAFTFKDGDSAEELSLPFLIISIYIMAKALRENRFVSKKEATMIGVLAGCVFWIKFSLIGMYIGWFIAFAFIAIKNRNVKELLYSSLYIILGVAIATTPFIVYFGVNNAIIDWLKTYIYDNIFIYSEEKTSVLGSLKFGLSQFAEKNKTVFNMCLAALMASFCQKKKDTFFYLFLMIGFEFLLIYMGGKHYRYYSFVMNAFIPLGIVCLFKLFENEVPGWLNSKIVISTITACCILLSFYLTPNRYLFGVTRNELPQYRFAEIMYKEKDDPTLLNYECLDAGFYTAANIFPNCKAFCKLNIEKPEMLDLQNYYIENGLCDFIVSKEEYVFNKYELVETMSFPYNETVQTFYLYKLK